MKKMLDASRIRERDNTYIVDSLVVDAVRADFVPAEDEAAQG
jgi:hypothetical protein